MDDRLASSVGQADVVADAKDANEEIAKIRQRSDLLAA